MSGFFWGSYVALWITVLLLAVGFVALARQIGLLYGRLTQTGARMENAGPNPGEAMAPFSGTDIYGNSVQVPVPDHAYTLLMFVTSSCSVCDQVAPAVASIAARETNIAVVLMTFIGDEDMNRGYAKAHHLSHLPFVLSHEFATRLGVFTTPYGLLVRRDGIVGSKGLVNNREQLDSLITAVELKVESLQAFAAAHATAL